MGDGQQRRDFWDKADVLSKWLIPVVVAIGTVVVTMQTSDRQARMKTFEVAAGILHAEGASKKTPELYKWAVEVFKETTGAADANLTQPALDELNGGVQIPTPRVSVQSSAESTSRVRILRLAGAPAAVAEAVAEGLRQTGVEAPAVAERSVADFPRESEVRFYYKTDEAAASALKQYLISLGIPARLNDRSGDNDATLHLRGELHAYLR
jgi:hypothetical protein